jgi:DNA-binding NtrC family response regulator
MLGGVHDVVTIERAAFALELLERDPSFDVIICDLLMPEMSGMEFYDELARRSSDLASRVIFLSGGASAELAGKFFASARVVALQKPPSMAELLLAIERQLEASGRGALPG